jgi:rubrerythrin
MKGWTLDDIPWHRFDAAKVDAETLKVVKAACLVEHNGEDYARYLTTVFPDDTEFVAAAGQWAAEEVQHGQVLRRWAELADPEFDFDAAFSRFRAGFQVSGDGQGSVRGSRTGELVSRCIIETGTSGWYLAIQDSTQEPLLRTICGQIAADELRHYKLFYRYLKHYLVSDRLSRWDRVRVAVARIAETGDDELAYAYFAANGGGMPYDRQYCTRAYSRTALSFYRPHHVDRGVGMMFKAVGLNPQGWLRRIAVRFAWGLLVRRARELQRYPA